MADTKKLLNDAKAVLKNNDHGCFTAPAGDLYPHQWLWDSCFIAIGLRHTNIDRAKAELKSLLRGQWSNGMLPNMIFSEDVLYTQDRNVWRSHLSISSPSDASTTGITQPPMLAEAVVQVGKKLKKAERRTWYADMLPAIIAYHQWLYRDRDPKESGLVLQLHPYETGLDSTPPWLDQLHKHHRPWWATIIEKSNLVSVVNLVRRDTRHVPPGQRMDNMDALLYYDVIRKLRSKHYDSKAMLRKSAFAIEDVSFNSIFVRANQHLTDMAEFIGRTLPEDLVERMDKSKLAIEQLWDSYSKQYYSKNHTTGRLIRVPSIGTLMPLYSGTISKERANHLVAMLHSKDFFNTDYPVASVPVSAKEFSPLRYWQGPAWLNTNWLIADGLNRYGFTSEASVIRKKSLELVEEHGCYEYFSPIDGSPAGAKNFSWTAALAIDFLQTKTK